MSEATFSPAAEIRIDVWLWAARFFKTRSLAKQAVVGGRVELNGAGCKPSRAVRAGDRLDVRRGEERMQVEVLGLADQRGPATVAQTLYRETEASRLAREAAREQRRLIGASALHPQGRPGKHDRAALRRLKGIPDAGD
ncbi:RNA-binding S4 domain-containing protein [Dyella sp.]|jgi:ribosome-associated heat shock protein Hsp15|uniref:RNA-binding S4 domain-containing protein n=1 Tax=Dyella sp. TaxID=1869338 RepID=UPI002D7837C5|nr:RNA-binding S4 domain-containing protein [Dyella sp.]HET6431002.1 RNA-binding S4 domain-containing protein [Dyella sp.]